MYSTQDIEKGMVDAISELAIPTIAYPQLIEGYFPTHSPGEVLVRYDGCKPKSTDVSTVMQEVDITIEVVFVSQQLRDENGIYDWLDKVRGKLQGCTLKNIAGHLELVEEGYYNYNEGTWFYHQIWKIAINGDYEQQTKHDTPIFG